MFDFLKSRQTDQLFLGQTDKTIMHLGNDTKGRPICMDSETLRNHILLTGSTGAGKTEALLGFMTNAFSWGSGGVFVDGKGDVSLYAKMATIAEHFGRRDDLYVLNFMSGNNASTLHGGFSHRFNPFARATSDAITQMIVSLVDDVESTMWKGRMTAMLTGIVRLLCWRRDNRGDRLDAAVIRDNVSLRSVIGMAYDEAYDDVPPQIRKSIKSYLSSLPGYAENRGYGQSQTTMDQHGYMEMQLVRMFGEMCDVYGHIFTAGETDIDMEDIVLNRRFLLVMLPALEKSKDSIASLGKIVAAALKAMTGSVLGRPIAGTWEDLQADRDENKRKQAPFLCIMDEVAYYLVDGFDLMAAQARSLNISMIFACQDMYSLFRTAGSLGRAIVSSTRTKIAMRSDAWHAEMDGAFASAEPGRNDVVSYITRSKSKGKVKAILPTMGSVLSHFEAGDFMLASSGKLLVGRAHYVKHKMSKRSINLSLTRFRSTAAVADDLIRLETATAADDAPTVAMPLPKRLVRLCEAGNRAVSEGAYTIMGVALSAMAERDATDTNKEIMRLGE